MRGAGLRARVGGWGCAGSASPAASQKPGRALHHIRLNICPHPVLVVDVYG